VADQRNSWHIYDLPRRARAEYILVGIEKQDVTVWQAFV
jgi:hypothetical protein